MGEYDGVFPETHAEVLALPGIGPYTAGAIASICFSLPYPAVDGNVLRVYSRLTELSESIDSLAVKKHVTDALAPLYLESDPAMLNQALMELGALVCLPNGAPLCTACPLSHLCCAYAASTMLSYPIRTPKKARRLETKTVFILTCGDKLAVHKREESGLLGGLWALPNVSGALNERDALDQAVLWDVKPTELIYAKQKKHIFTHVEWHMRGYYIECRAESPKFTWVSETERSEQVALPTAFRQFLTED
jgi:A/G-specific adenine glycosylase